MQLSSWKRTRTILKTQSVFSPTDLRFHYSTFQVKDQFCWAQRLGLVERSGLVEQRTRVRLIQLQTKMLWLRICPKWTVSCLVVFRIFGKVGSDLVAAGNVKKIRKCEKHQSLKFLALKSYCICKHRGGNMHTWVGLATKCTLNCSDCCRSCNFMVIKFFLPLRIVSKLPRFCILSLFLTIFL